MPLLVVGGGLLLHSQYNFTSRHGVEFKPWMLMQKFFNFSMHRNPWRETVSPCSQFLLW